MTPNNQTINKFNENDDKTEEIISGLKKLILEDNKCISYTYVSLRFGVHVKQAIQILDKFVVEERNNGNTLSLNYLLSGNNDTSDNDNEIKMERFMIINESELESSTDWFKNGFNQHIYSVGFGEDNDKIDLNFDEFDYEVKEKRDLNELHNLRYIKNPNIELRDVRRRVAIKPTLPKSEDKDEQKKSISTETKSKPKTNTKAKNTKKNKASNMFSKNKKEVKVEEEDKETADPFGSDSEEDIKPNIDDQISDKNKDVSDEEVVEVEVVEPIVKNGSKRHSKNDSNSSEDEEIISTKRRTKKYKRVRLISETDSEEEEKPLDKFVSNKKDNSKPIKKMKEIKETHVDEDGYVVTKTVKKEVEDKDDQQLKTETEVMAKTKTEKMSNDSESEDKSEIKEKTKQNPKKNTEKKVEKKSTKPSKDTKSKNQSSITSFFKPKQIPI